MSSASTICRLEASGVSATSCKIQLSQNKREWLLWAHTNAAPTGSFDPVENPKLLAGGSPQKRPVGLDCSSYLGRRSSLHYLQIVNLQLMYAYMTLYDTNDLCERKCLAPEALSPRPWSWILSYDCMERSGNKVCVAVE